MTWLNTMEKNEYKATSIEYSSTHFLKKKYSYSINQVSGLVTYTYV
jgi:hypothetical protein